MKRLTLLLALSWFACNAFAYPTADLHLRTSEGGSVNVVIDGYTFTSYDNKILIEGLSAGTHRLQVFTPAFFYGNRHARNVLVYDGFISLSPNSEVFASVNGIHNLKIIKTVFKVPDYKNDCYNEYNYYYDPVVHYAMNDESFRELKNTISTFGFESSREGVMHIAIEKNYLTSVQIADLLNMLSFESTRLEIAKDAYDKVIDPQNYFRVFNAFSFESSVEDLQQYMASR